MKILFIGNIGSGKTTLAVELSKAIGFKFCSIDDCRRNHSDGSHSGEYMAISNFLKSIESRQEGIYEFTGVGAHKHTVRYALEAAKQMTVVIYVWVEDKMNRNRITQKEWDIPYPFEFDLQDHMDYVDRELKEGREEGFWSSSHLQTEVWDVDNTAEGGQEELSKKLEVRVRRLLDDVK